MHGGLFPFFFSTRHDPPDAVFRHHGESLLKLDIRNDESTTTSALTLSNDRVRQLSTLAPGLTHLTLNLGRHRTSPNGTDLAWREDHHTKLWWAGAVHEADAQ